MKAVKLRSYWSLLLISSLALLVSCKGPAVKYPSPPHVEEERSPDRVKDLINERIRSIRTVEGRLIITSNKEPYAGRYKALLFFKRPSQFRIKIFQSFGPTLSDLVMKGNSIEAYIPSKNTVFKADLDKGTRRQRPGSTPLDSIKGILQMGIDESEELSLSQTPNGDILLNHSKDGRLVKKTEIDPRSLFIKREILFGTGGQPDLITTYSKYKKTNGQWWPFRIEFREPMKEPFMSFEFQSVKTNGHIEPDVFKLDVPPGVITVRQ